jgi:hypothetical protein
MMPITQEGWRAYVERMRRAWAERKACWEAQPGKVYLVSDRDGKERNPDAAYITRTARIHWRTAEAICGFRVHRGRAYFLHEGKVLEWWFGLCDEWPGTPLLEYEDEGIAEAVASAAHRRTINSRSNTDP